MGSQIVGHNRLTFTSLHFKPMPWSLQKFSQMPLVAEPICQCRRPKRYMFYPWVEKISWRKAWQRTPVFLNSWLENPMDRGVCWATVHGVAKSWAWLSEHTRMHAHAACVVCFQPSFSVSLPHAPRSFSCPTVSFDLTRALLTQDSELFCMIFPLPLFQSIPSSFMSQRVLHCNSKGYAVLRIRDAVMGEMGSLESAAGKHPGHPYKSPTICCLQDSWRIPAHLQLPPVPVVAHAFLELTHFS